MSKMERDILFMEIRNLGITMTQVADRCEISKAQLSRFFKNQINMSGVRIKRVLDYVEELKQQEEQQWI